MLVRFKEKHKDERLIVRVKLSYGDAVSDAELESFAHIYIRGFLKPKKIRKNLIEYTGPMSISLYERMKKSVTKYEFFIIMEQIVDLFQKLQQNNLLPGRVIWDIHHVYYNEFTRELQFLYIPFTTAKNSGNIESFMASVGYAAIPQQEPDMEYISRFMFFLNSLPAFDAGKIESCIAHEDRKAADMIKKNGSKRSGFMTDKPKDYYEHYEKQIADDEDNPTGRLEEDDETERLETGLLEEDKETGLLNDEYKTELLDQNRVNIHYPSLFCVLTEESVLVNKPVFRIGKERSYVDFFIANNNFVSRGHADIITRGQRYFVMDLNSKNKTFVNDQVIPAQEEIEIFDGDHLKFANEEFVFYLS